jgi:hypothetical protein
MSFYVTPRRSGETRIHKSSCSYCKDGKGVGSVFKVRRNNTAWSPPLATLVEAEAYVRNHHHHGKVVRCGHCLAPSAYIQLDESKTRTGTAPSRNVAIFEAKWAVDKELKNKKAK